MGRFRNPAPMAASPFGCPDLLIDIGTIRTLSKELGGLRQLNMQPVKGCDRDRAFAHSEVQRMSSRTPVLLDEVKMKASHLQALCI